MRESYPSIYTQHQYTSRGVIPLLHAQKAECIGKSISIHGLCDSIDIQRLILMMRAL